MIFHTNDAHFKTITGNIEIDFENDQNHLGFDITTTTGSIKAFNIDASGSYILPGKTYNVTGISTTGKHIYY